MLHAINRHHLTVAVGLAAVVHEARGVALSHLLMSVPI
jgi:hypothetical protein